MGNRSIATAVLCASALACSPVSQTQPELKLAAAQVAAADITSASTVFQDAVSGPVVKVQQTGTGSALSATSASGNALFAQLNGAAGQAVLGSALSTSGETIALMGVDASSSGTGVLGTAYSGTGSTYGVRGLTVSPEGTGVWGSSSGQSGQTIGLRGDVVSPSGFAIYGRSAAASGNTYGLWAESASSAGTAAFGVALASQGATIGLRGEARSPQGIAGVFDNVAGGHIVSARVRGVEKLGVDGQGNLTTAGVVSASAVTGGALSVVGTADLFEWMVQPLSSGGALSLLHGASSGQPSATGLSINGDGSINFAPTQKFPASSGNFEQALLQRNTGQSGAVAMLPDSSDSVHSYIGQSGDQFHLRVSRAVPDGNGAKDLLIGPYAYGMGVEYSGTLEFWAHDFSVHMNHLTGDPNAAANFWVGDEIDSGGLFSTAHWNQGSNANVVLAADKFDHTSHGSLDFQVRDPKDAFLFQAGPFGREVSQAQISSTASGNELVVFAGTTAAHLQADSRVGARLTSSVGAQLTLASGATSGVSAYPSGNVSIGGAGDAAALAVGSGAGFQVSTAGAVTIGGGAPILQHLSARTSLAFSTFTALGCQELSIAIAGAADGDTVALGIPAALASAQGLIFSGYVSQPDLVTVRGCNATARDVSVPGAATVRADVWKH